MLDQVLFCNLQNNDRGSHFVICYLTLTLANVDVTSVFSRLSPSRTYNISPPLSAYYRPEDSDDIAFICSTNRENGMLRCSDVPQRKVGGAYCELNAHNVTDAAAPEPDHRGCVNWNIYYNICRASEHNPHNGAINFDNIGYAWIAIFQVNYLFYYLFILTRVLTIRLQNNHSLFYKSLPRFIS